MSSSPINSYEQAISFLYERINYEQAKTIPYQESHFKLDRMDHLLDRLGRPEGAIPIVHVAGTKGKGSTSAMIAAVLSASGYKTGLYTSPHLEFLEERFVIDGISCAPERLVALTEQLRGVVEKMDRDSPAGSPTYFEITTAMALLCFAEAEVDIMVLEVGLGGRLDSTNVCTPSVSVITNVSYDHTKQLGSTLDRIAREKGGIIKPGIPVVSGVREPDAKQVIEAIASQQKAELFSFGDHFFIDYEANDSFSGADSDEGAFQKFGYRLAKEHLQYSLSDVALGLWGRHQAENAALVLTTLALLREKGWDLPEASIRAGLRTARCPARIEILAKKPWIILDTAHNVSSIDALIATLGDIPVSGRRRLLFATSGDKDVAGILKHLLPSFDDVVFTQFVSNPRSVDPQQLATLATDLSLDASSTRIEPDPIAAWRLLQREAIPDDLLCITGSFFLAAELREEVSINSTPLI